MGLKFSTLTASAILLGLAACGGGGGGDQGTGRFTLSVTDDPDADETLPFVTPKDVTVQANLVSTVNFAAAGT